MIKFLKEWLAKREQKRSNAKALRIYQAALQLLDAQNHQ